MPAVALAAVAGGHARDQQCRASQRQSHVGAVERRHPAVAEPRARADDPGAGADDRRVPAEHADAVVERARRAHGLELAAVGRARGDVAREQPLSAQSRHRARVRARERAAAGLDVAEPRPRARLRVGPGHRRELAVQREHPHRPSERQLERLRADGLDRLDGVLQARVVQLHHVAGVRTGGAQAAREVGVHDVEAARAEAEVQGLDVHDHLIAGVRGAHERDVRDRLTALRRDAGVRAVEAGRGAAGRQELDRQTLLPALRAGRRGGVDHCGAAQLEHLGWTLARRVRWGTADVVGGRCDLVNKRQSHTEHLLQGHLGDPLAGLVVALGAVREVHGREALGDQRVGV